MKEIIRVKLDPSISDYLEYQNYLKITDEKILETILLKKSEYEFNQDTFDHFYSRMVEHEVKRASINRELIKEYAGEKYISEGYTVEFNFEDKEMILYEN